MKIGTRIRHVQNPDKVTGRVIGVGTGRFRGQVQVLYDRGEIYFSPVRFLISNDSDAKGLVLADGDPSCMEDEELADTPVEDLDEESTQDSTQTESDGDEPLESSEEDKSILIED
jgi:hypothetical protein